MADQRRCPYCNVMTTVPVCTSCGRDVTSKRRLCGKCNEWTPASDSFCCHCGDRKLNEWLWRVPLMVVLFLAAMAASICIGVLDS